MSRYLDALHDLETAAEISETSTSPTVETVETPTKQGIDSLDSTPNGPFPDFRGFTEAELKAAAGEDWPEIEGDTDALERFALNLLTSAHPMRTVRGFNMFQLSAAAGEDWPEVRGNPHLLDAFVSALEIRQQRERGERPSDYTQASDCDGCGPVWLWEGAPAHVLACPWCWNRWEGRPLPEPPSPAHEAAPAADPEPEPAPPEPAPIRCGTCRHFRPSPSTPSAGVGACRIDAPITRGQPARWPLVLHHCREWQPTDDLEDTAA